MTIVAANWVGENTSTVGTGPLALSGAISTFCPFSVLPDGSEVYYTLQEGFNRETGIGVVSNGSLTRNVQATLVAGVYTETNIPISLSGNGQVFAVINADFMTRIYNFSLDVADSVAAAAASAQAAADSAALANDYETQSAQNAEDAAASALSASDSKVAADASKTAAANSASAAANSQADAANSASAANTAKTSAEAAAASVNLPPLGIGLPTQPDIDNFDWQNFVFTSGANYVTSYDTWVNPPAGITYDAGTRISIRVIYISTTSGPRMGLELTPDTGAAANFKVYKLLCVGAAGSRVFTFNQDWNSANPVPITGGGTGATTAAGALVNLGLGTAAKKNTGSNPGDVVTAASDQPVYNSTLPTSGYTNTAPSGYFSSATVTGGNTLVRVVGLNARNVADNWTLVNSYGSHFGTGGSIQPEDAAHVLVSTDGADYTRHWYFYNDGTLRGPSGDFGDMAWVNNKVGTVDGVITLGNGINVKKVAIPDLPPLAYTGVSSRGILSTATGQADAATKAHSIQLNKPGSWSLNMSWGTYVGASGSAGDVAHLLCSTDGAAFSRNWWFYNNGNLVGPGGKFYSERNTTRAADGTLKAASPVIKLFSDGRAETNAESEGCIATRLAVGEYLIEGCNGLNSDAAWGGPDGGFDVPTDRNKQPLIWLDYEVNPDGSVLLKTYHRSHPDSPQFARNEREGYSSGDPIDIPTGQFVSVRVGMQENSIYHQKQETERKAVYEAWLAATQRLRKRRSSEIVNS